ncbi:regulatory protein, tetR family [Evansella caseinilytica]|uniref:Regulatory protein, tetR family n=1 Tax=Evansella caseinilytica TaxID=1503961 RepID=A0A1H3UTY0_9BACI|nr:TetR/AcrR family transcriptional regulator [Evansella caseinilytica]SDZ65788.1 regulatory protein, tetR family [Evansella caseinilytica]
MYSAFEKLPEEKKQRILRICMEEFSNNGYANTSTDTITNRAGISKGILFHYFKNKKNLYFYIVEYASELLSRKLLGATKKATSTDYFERIKEVAVLKQKVQWEYIVETKLVANALLHSPLEIKTELSEIIQRSTNAYKEHEKNMENNYKKYLEDQLNKGMLKEGLSPEKIIQLTTYILKQLSDKYLYLIETQQLDIKDLYDKVIPEMDEYIHMMKYGIYKEQH